MRLPGGGRLVTSAAILTRAPPRSSFAAVPTRRSDVRPPLWVWAVFLPLAAWWARYLSQHPGLNWDVVMYVACVLEPDHAGAPAALQAATLDVLRAQLPAAEYAEFTTGDYGARVASDAAFFDAELAKYRVKPLYVAAARAAYRLGAPAVAATVWPSALGAVGLAALLLVWVGRHRSAGVALAAALLLMVSHPLWYVGRFSTPDMLSAPLLMLACYLVYRRAPAWAVAVAGVVAVGVRLDNVLACGALVLVAAYAQALGQGRSRGWSLRLVGGLAAAGLALAVGGSVALGHDPLSLLGAYAHVYTAEGYAFHWTYSYTQFAHRSSGALIAGVAALAYAALDGESRRIVRIAAAVVALRLMAFPLFEERFFVGFEWAVLAAVGAGLGPKTAAAGPHGGDPAGSSALG